MDKYTAEGIIVYKNEFVYFLVAGVPSESNDDIETAEYLAKCLNQRESDNPEHKRRAVGESE